MSVALRNLHFAVGADVGSHGVWNDSKNRTERIMFLEADTGISQWVI